MLPEEKIRELLSKYKYYLLLLALGIFLVSLGLFMSRNVGKTQIEVLEATTEAQRTFPEIVVEIAGEVENPGVYTLPKDARVEDLLVAAGGISPNADRDWMRTTLNRVAKLTDGQKIYIPSLSEQSSR